MSVEQMQNEDKKEIKQQSKTIENAIVDEQITPEEVLDVKKTTDFLETLNKKESTEIKESKEIKEKIEAYKDDILNSIYQYFIIPDKETGNKKRLDENKVKEITDEKIAQAYINLIDWTGTEGLDVVKEKLNEQIKKIEANNTAAENSEAIAIIARNMSTPNVLFETGSEEDFNLVMKLLSPNGDEVKITDEDKDINKLNFLKLIRRKTGNEELSEITVGKRSDDFGSRFLPETWLVFYGTDENSVEDKEKWIFYGTNQKGQENIAKQAEEKIKKIEFNGPESIYSFTDDIGNSEAFKIFLEDKNTDYINQHFEDFINGIKNYEEKTITYEEEAGGDYIKDTNGFRKIKKAGELDDSGTELTENETGTHNEVVTTHTVLGESFVKNGYANVLTDYVIGHPDIMKTYIKHLTIENQSILGVDRETQVKNFNNLVNSSKFKEIEKGLSQDEKQIILDLRFNIEQIDKITFQEGLQGKFKETIEKYGGFILSIVEFLGGKGALRKFCAKFGIDYDKYFKDLEKLYDDTYALSPEQKKLLEDIPDKEKEERSKATDNDMYNYVGGEKTPIPCNKKAITNTYKELFTNENFNLLDATLVEAAMKELKIGNGNVIMTKKGYGGINNKEINSENTLSAEQKSDIVNYIIYGKKDPSANEKGKKEIREKVQEAGNDITQTDSVYNSELPKDKEISQEMLNEQKNAEISKDIKGFEDAVGIGIYFGAYLMKGSKDLKYTISQTDNLPFEEGNRTPTPTVIEKPETEAKITFNDGINQATGLVTDETKAIHEVIAMDTAPEKIKVTSGTIETIAVIKTIDGTVTYIPEKNKDKTDLTINDRVKIYVGDKIEAVKSPEELYTENMKKIDEQQEYISNGKYKSFDFTDFTYNENADADQKQYQENILAPLANIITNEEQYKILAIKVNGKNIKNNSIKTIANTLSMIDTKDNIKKPLYKETIDILNNNNNNNNTYEIESNGENIIITSKGNNNGTIDIKNTDGKLTTERKETTTA